jgi:DNA N-6-adenine-methyltransferase (Dam)
MMRVSTPSQDAFTPPTKSNEWYTPAKYIEAAREVMGTIDLDPASCAMANETVRASRYYSREENGLERPWYGNVWLNPPYAQDNSQPNGKKSGIRKWVENLIEQFNDGDINQAIALLTTQTNTTWFELLWGYPICFTRKNIRFYTPFGRNASRNPDKATWKTDAHTFGTIFVYLGPNEQHFINIFSQFGTIAKRVNTVQVQEYPRTLWEVQ